MGFFFEGRRVCSSETSGNRAACRPEFAAAFEEEPHTILKPLNKPPRCLLMRKLCISVIFGSHPKVQAIDNKRNR
jgi:hypothetical protein